MPSRAEMARDAAVNSDNNSVNVATQQPPVPTSRLPGPLRFLLHLFLTLSTSAGLYTAAAEFMDPALPSITSPANQDLKVIAVLGWKVVLVALGYGGGYDDIDVVALSFLTYAPFYYLLHTFYEIPLTTIVLCLGIDVSSITIPTRLLRPRSPAHNRNAPGAAVPNRNIINDSPTQAVNSLLGAAIYSTILYASFLTFLPRFMVVHFDGLRTLVSAHGATLPKLFATMLGLGWSAREFLLTPSLAAQSNLADIRAKAFNPEDATLAETVEHNVWGYSKKTKVLIKRTATLVFLAGLNTFISSFFVLDGADVVGAAGWSGVWVVASAVAGIAFGWVGEV